jgi:hypothetical protein
MGHCVMECKMRSGRWLDRKLSEHGMFGFFDQTGYAASAPPVTRKHWAPATWPPGSYHDRTYTGQPTMTFQGTPWVRLGRCPC